MVAVASFDVFETALVRRVGDPAAVFGVLGHDLRRRGEVTSAARFAIARQDAERYARRRVGRSADPTLDDIYRQLAWSLRWDDVRRDATMKLELELEADLLQPNPAAVARIATARRRGLRIAFTSDTYLPRAFLEQQLRRHGCWQEGDLLLVSCERGSTKRAGGLFADLAATTGRSARQHVHVGNDERSDVHSARAAGFRVAPMSGGNLTADEQRLDAHRDRSGGLASAFAGCSRLTRLQDTDADTAPGLRDAAADVMAPALVAYVLWILREAQRQELASVYFLSREGQVLRDVAEILVEKLGLGIEVRYLYASRQSMNLAAIERGSRTELAWTLTHAETNTIRALLGRLRLVPEELRAELAELGVVESEWDRVPDAAGRSRLFASMIDGALRPLVLQQAAQVRDTALEYLEQEGFLAAERVGVVDVSGVGSQFKALAALRARAGRDAAQGFLFVRSRDPYLEAQGGYAEGELPPMAVYLDDAVTGVGLGVPLGLVAMLEMFCAADHGTVLDYERTPDGIAPVLASETAEHLIAWGLPSVRAVVRRFSEQLWLDERYVDLDGELRAGVRELLERFWTRPTAQEARAWGGHPFDGTSGSEEPVPLASGLSASDVLRAVRHGGIVPEHWFGWGEGSKHLSPAPVRWTLEVGRSVKHVRQRLRRR